MLDVIIKELNELKDFKSKYEHSLVDRRTMAKKLFQLMIEKHNNQTYEERCEIHRNDYCKCCRSCGCGRELPEDVLTPIENNDWIPSIKTCKHFELS